MSSQNSAITVIKAVVIAVVITFVSFVIGREFVSDAFAIVGSVLVLAVSLRVSRYNFNVAAAEDRLS
jgi:small neutral amino acid transporter SnatA (MarC family)